MSLKKLLKKKKAQDVLNGKAFEVDYKRRLKRNKLKKQYEMLILKQSNFTHDLDEYYKIQKSLDSIQHAINKVEQDLEGDLLFSMSVYELDKQLS